MLRIHLFALALCLACGCLETHDASLGEQERTGRTERGPDAGAGADAGSLVLDAGPDATHDAEHEEDEEEDDDDAGTSLLCLLEPWHCT